MSNLTKLEKSIYYFMTIVWVIFLVSLGATSTLKYIAPPMVIFIVLGLYWVLDSANKIIDFYKSKEEQNK